MYQYRLLWDISFQRFQAQLKLIMGNIHVMVHGNKTSVMKCPKSELICV